MKTGTRFDRFQHRLFVLPMFGHQRPDIFKFTGREQVFHGVEVAELFQATNQSPVIR